MQGVAWVDRKCQVLLCVVEVGIEHGPFFFGHLRVLFDRSHLAPTLQACLVVPAATVASVVRRGAVDTMNEAHQAIARWAEANGHTSSVEVARWREIYLETNDADHSDWLIEVQLELVGTPAG